MANLDRALAIALRAHKNQKDKSGKPYILHPLRVMLKMNSEAEMIVAVLHDVLEDSNVSIDDLLKEGFSPEVIKAVDCLTKRPQQNYMKYLEQIKSNPLAVKVKLADLEDNMDIRRLPEILPKDQERLAKYRKAYSFLKHEI